MECFGPRLVFGMMTLKESYSSSPGSVRQLPYDTLGIKGKSHFDSEGVARTPYLFDIDVRFVGGGSRDYSSPFVELLQSSFVVEDS